MSTGLLTEAKWEAPNANMSTRTQTRGYRLWRQPKYSYKRNMGACTLWTAQISGDVASGSNWVDWFHKQFPFVKYQYFHYSDIPICPLIDLLTEILSTNKLLAIFAQNYQVMSWLVNTLHLHLPAFPSTFEGNKKIVPLPGNKIRGRSRGFAAKTSI